MTFAMLAEFLRPRNVQVAPASLAAAFPGPVQLSITDNRHEMVSFSRRAGVLCARVPAVANPPCPSDLDGNGVPDLIVAAAVDTDTSDAVDWTGQLLYSEAADR